MEICKFQDIWKTLFSWVLPVPENAHKAKCKYCPGKLIDIKCGSQALKRHEACSIHMKAVTSVAGSNIVAQMQAGARQGGHFAPKFGGTPKCPQIAPSIILTPK